MDIFIHTKIGNDYIKPRFQRRNIIIIEDLIQDNGIYNYNASDFLHALYEDYGDESIDMFLCDFPYTFKGKNRLTANK